MIFREKWTANIAGQPGTIYRAEFSSQKEQVAYLCEIVKAYRGTETIKSTAVRIVFDEYHLPPRALAAHAAAIGDWVQKNIRYVNEGEETFYTPIQTLRVMAADCDDHSTLIRSLCESLGIPTRFRALKWDGGFQHIYAEAAVRIGGKMTWLPLDSTLTDPIGTNPLVRAVKEHGDVRVFTMS